LAILFHLAAMSGSLLKLKWRQTSPRWNIGVLLEEEAAVRKIGKSRVEEQTRPQRYLPLKEFAREAL